MDGTWPELTRAIFVLILRTPLEGAEFGIETGENELFRGSSGERSMVDARVVMTLWGNLSA